MKEYSLLNAADGSLMDLDTRKFEDSLTMNILFQERILLHEPNFFNSNFIIDHIRRRPSELSLFELACRSGLIIPAFRDPKMKGLEEVRRAEPYGTSIVKLVDRFQRLVPPFDSGDNFVGVGGPSEGFGLGIMVGNEAVDGGLQIDN